MFNFRNRNPTFAHYQSLGVEKEASTEMIRKAYRRLAMDHHPDKGGDTTKFQKIQEAYAVLSDPEKREQYDLGGDGQPIEVKQRQHRQKFMLTLAEMYAGGEKQVQLKYEMRCIGCSGRGGEGKTCETCKGSKITQTARAIAPGMYQMMRQQCLACQGKGREIKKPCQGCRGTGKIDKSVSQSVSFVKGVLPNDEIEVEVEGESIILHVTPKRDAQFSRHMFDLNVSVTISFVQALTGIDIIIPHINGDYLRVNTTQPLHETRYLVRQGGMPIDDSYRPRLRGVPADKLFGDLYVQFDIEWPTSLTLVQKQQLIEHFPYAKPRIESDRLKDVPLEEVETQETPQQCTTQ